MRWLFYGILALLPLGGILAAFLLARRFKHERDEARATVEKMMAKNPVDPSRGVPLKSIAASLRGERRLEAGIEAYNKALANQLRMETKTLAVGTPKRLDEGMWSTAVPPVHTIGSGRALNVAGHDRFGGKLDEIRIDWDKMVQALGKRMSENADDVVYVISPDDFEQLKADIELHRLNNTPLEAKESEEGIVTMRLGGITYHIAKELFALVESFWNPKSSSPSWHR